MGKKKKKTVGFEFPTTERDIFSDADAIGDFLSSLSSEDLGIKTPVATGKKPYKKPEIIQVPYNDNEESSFDQSLRSMGMRRCDTGALCMGAPARTVKQETTHMEEVSVREDVIENSEDTSDYHSERPIKSPALTYEFDAKGINTYNIPTMVLTLNKTMIRFQGVMDSFMVPVQPGGELPTITEDAIGEAAGLLAMAAQVYSAPIAVYDCDEFSEMLQRIKFKESEDYLFINFNDDYILCYDVGCHLATSHAIHIFTSQLSPEVAIDTVVAAFSFITQHSFVYTEDEISGVILQSLALNKTNHKEFEKKLSKNSIKCEGDQVEPEPQVTTFDNFTDSIVGEFSEIIYNYKEDESQIEEYEETPYYEEPEPEDETPMTVTEKGTGASNDDESFPYNFSSDDDIESSGNPGAADGDVQQRNDISPSDRKDTSEVSGNSRTTASDKDENEEVLHSGRTLDVRHRDSVITISPKSEEKKEESSKGKPEELHEDGGEEFEEVEPEEVQIEVEESETSMVIPVFRG